MCELLTSRPVWGLQAQQAAAEVTSNPYKTLFSRRYRPQLIITVLVRDLPLPAATHLVLHAMSCHFDGARCSALSLRTATSQAPSC